MVRWRWLLGTAVVLGGLHIGNHRVAAELRTGGDELKGLATDCVVGGIPPSRRIEACNRALTFEYRSDRRAVLLTWRGWQQRAVGNEVGALGDFEAALKITPHAFEPQRGRAVILSDLNRFGPAEQAFTGLLRDYETNPILYVDRGIVHVRAGRPDKALADFNTALTLNPRHADALVRRGRIALIRKQLDAALSDLDAALAVDAHETSALYWRAITLSQKGDQTAALKTFNLLVLVEPNDAQNWLQRGMVFEQLKDFAAALRSYDIGLKHAPKHQALLFRRAFNLSWLGRSDEAVAAYDSVLAVNPDEATSRANRAWHLTSKGLYDAAMSDLKRAIALEPRNGHFRDLQGRVFFALKNYDQAQRSFSKALALGKEGSTELYNTRGRSLLRLHRYREAAADFDEVIRRVPKSLYGYYNRGLVAQRQKLWSEALSFYEKALEVEPGEADAIRMRNEMLVKLGREGEVWRLRLVEAAQALRRATLAAQNKAKPATTPSREERLKKLDAALEYDSYDNAGRLERARLLTDDAATLERAADDVELILSRDAGHLDALMQRSRIRYARNEYARALEDAERVLAASPRSAYGFFWRARSQAALGRDDDAIVSYTEAVSSMPRMDSAWHNRGLLHRQARRFDQAAADLSESIRLKPDKSVSWRYRGLVRRAQKRWQEALDDMEQALRLAPDNHAVIIDIGNTLYESGDYRAAVAYVSAAMERGITSALIWSNRCYYRVLLKEFEAARADCAEALRLEPGRPTTYHSLGVMKMHEGDLDAALAFFELSIRGNARGAFSHFGRAIALKRRGEAERAAEAFATARELDADIDARYREVGFDP